MWLLRQSKTVFFTICCVSGMAAIQHVGAQGESACKVRDQNGAIAIVICPPGLGRADWHKAGEMACANIKPCSAWIWDDPKKAPQSAPPLATGIAKDAVLSSAAIWDNDGKKLITISKVKK